MRKIILLLIIILICSFTFAELKPLIKYSSDSVNSHACTPSSGNCAYINSVLISDVYLGGTKILGLSKDPIYPGTNAHVEIANDLGNPSFGEYVNYSDYGIYLTAAGASKCIFKKGNNCGGKNCVFGLSDETNAHLSRCDTFENEIKLCCDFDVVIVNYPVGTDTNNCEVDLFEASSIFVDEKVNVTYSCSTITDANIMVFDSKGNPLLPSVFQTSCNPVKQVYDGYSFQNPEQIAIVTIETENCIKEKIFVVKSRVQSAIPDNNLFLVLFIVMVVSVILVKKKD